MTQTKDSDRSISIPRWFSYKDLHRDEFSFPRRNVRTINQTTRDAIKDDFRDFTSHPTVTSAIAVVGSSLLSTQQATAEAAISYLADQPGLSPTIANLVSRLQSHEQTLAGATTYNSEIHRIRALLRQQNRNSILWTELARLYTIKNNIDRARHSIAVAAALAPTNRFVIRSAVRFYIHVNEPDRAYSLSHAATSLTDDPWLAATEINSAMLAGIKPHKFRRLDIQSISGADAFHSSELLDSLGTLYYKDGNTKLSRRSFRIAWSQPTEAVIAHGEWIIRNFLASMATEISLDYSKSAEASAWEKYFSMDLPEALDYATEWCLEEPYSTHPFTCASGIACDSGQFGRAARFATQGLALKPTDFLLKNNLAFAYCMNDNPEEAKKILHTIPKTLDNRQRVYFLATSGLYQYKKGHPEQGRKLYLESHDLALKIHDSVSAAKALLHLASNESQVDPLLAAQFADKALRESTNLRDPSVAIHRQRLVQTPITRRQN